MAGASARDPRESGRGGTAQDTAPGEQDTAPGDDNISRERADYAPTGADPKPTTGGTIKRTLKEFSEDGSPTGRPRSPTTACWRCSPR
jgi:membrane protein